MLPYFSCGSHAATRRQLKDEIWNVRFRSGLPPLLPLLEKSDTLNCKPNMALKQNF